jgi:hypothetical protein
MPPLLNVRQLAHIVADRISDEDALFERIRYLTIQRMIAPSDDFHPGKGHPRLYHPSVVLKIRVLNRLMDFGISLQTLQLVSEFIDSPVYERQKKLFGEDMFLVIEKLRNQEERKLSLWHRTESTQGRPFNMDSEAVLLIKLE